MNDNIMNGTNETTERRCVRRRTRNQGSEAHPRKLTIRMTEQLSNRVASIQGLIYKYGKRETMADIFETVLFPVLRSYVAPYVERAKADREAQKEVEA